MLPLSLGEPETSPARVLAIGAHPDDIEIGCAGTILKLIEEGAVSEVHWVVLSGDGERAEEARRSAEALLGEVPRSEVVVCDFPDGFFPYEGQRIKDFFERLKVDVSPDVVLTHQRADLHQDHRLCCELAWNSFRDHLILEYEVPKYDGDMGAPRLRADRGATAPAQGRPSDEPLRIAALQALVQGGALLEPAPAARHGVQLAELVRRGVLLP
jgi:LmbE family N-acetylglucosaminyl deacetylase